MKREILLYLLDAKFNDPMVLVQTSAVERVANCSHLHTYPLTWDPPPDTLFMRATDLDMGVFGEDLPSGSLQSVGTRHSRPSLERTLEAEVANTIDALVKYSAGSVTPDEVAAALRTGMWSQEPTKQRGAILQAAGFARCLLEAIRVADPDERAVVWEYTGGVPTYKYP